MTRIALVRHGETEWNRVRRVQGRSDIPLNDIGRDQVRRTAMALRTGPWTAVYSSPLSRAHESAEIIAEALGLAPPTVVDAITERDYGEAEGLTRVQLDRRYPGSIGVPGREPRSDVVARAMPALLEIARGHQRGGALVVSHGGLIRSLLMHLEPELGDHHTEPIVNGSVHSLDYVDGALSLFGFDEELVVPNESPEQMRPDIVQPDITQPDITQQNAVEAREAGAS